jgi:glycine/D-amino acid oxidase-like deaminating enzyme
MDLLLESGHLKGVITQKRTIHAKRILIASGAWSRHVAKFSQTNIPQAYVKQNVCSAKIKTPLSMSLLSSNDIALRQRLDGDVTLGCRGHMQMVPSLSVIRDIKLFLPIMMRMSRYFANYESVLGLQHILKGGIFKKCGTNAPLNPIPRMRPLNNTVQRAKKALNNTPLEIQKCWGGIVDGTPDAVPILGALKNYPNLYIASGLSGHGFGIGPAVGYSMAQTLMTNKSDIDLSSLSMERFNEPLKISVTF